MSEVFPIFTGHSSHCKAVDSIEGRGEDSGAAVVGITNVTDDG